MDQTAFFGTNDDGELIAFGGLLLPSPKVGLAEHLLRTFCRTHGLGGHPMAWDTCLGAGLEPGCEFARQFLTMVEFLGPVEFRAILAYGVSSWTGSEGASPPVDLTPPVSAPASPRLGQLADLLLGAVAFRRNDRGERRIGGTARRLLCDAIERALDRPLDEDSGPSAAPVSVWTLETAPACPTTRRAMLIS